MKKTYLLFVVLILIRISQSYSQYIYGSRSVCSGETANYTVYGPSCIVQVDGPEGLDYGTYLNNGLTSFSIRWTNNGTSAVTDNFTIYISARYWNPDGSQTGCPPYFAVPMSVTIKPNITSVARPGQPSIKYISGRLYEFTSSSSNADAYQWQITGATIQGSSSGKTVRVIRNSSSCTISAKVRGYAAGCSGNVYSSYSPTRSYTVPEPPVSYISGTSYLYPYSTLSYTLSFSTDDSEHGVVTSWSLSDPGGKLTLYSFSGNTVSVHMGGATSTLYFAQLSCNVSNGCGSKTVARTLMYGGSSSARTGQESEENVAEVSELTVFPNPIEVGGDIGIKRPQSPDMDEYMIYGAAGELICRDRMPSGPVISLSIPGLSKGVYLMRFLNKGELIATRKLVVR